QEIPVWETRPEKWKTFWRGTRSLQGARAALPFWDFRRALFARQPVPTDIAGRRGDTDAPEQFSRRAAPAGSRPNPDASRPRGLCELQWAQSVHRGAR